MDVVIYARYSSSKQNETSIEAQLIECRKFCKAQNYNEIGVYIDEALSGKTDDRLEFQKMITDSSKKLFQGIVVYQLDRFARNRYDSATYKAKLKKNGVRVLSAKENISDDPSGILMESVLEGMAEYYVAELGLKVSRNMVLNAEKGLFNGGPTPFGYRIVTVDCGTYEKRTYEIDPVTAPIVKEIYEMRANDVKVEDIVKHLNDKGFKTNVGKPFTKKSLARIFTNKRYIGTNTYKDKEFPNTVPAIIDVELFNKVQQIVNKHKIAPAMGKAKEEYILTTKLFCGHCRGAMTGTCGKSSNGTVHYYYACNNRKSKKCKKKAVPKYKIEDTIVEKCRQLLTDKNIKIVADKVYKICQQESSRSSLMKSLEKEVKKIEGNIENLLKAIESGENVDLLSDRLTQKRYELLEVNKKLDKERNNIVNLTKEKIRFFLEELKGGNINDIRYRKTLINLFVNRIYLFDDKVVLIMNVGTKKVTVNTALLEDIDTNLNLKNSLDMKTEGEPKKAQMAKPSGFSFASFCKTSSQQPPVTRGARRATRM